jgi:hypothetical protein
MDMYRNCDGMDIGMVERPMAMGYRGGRRIEEEV